jgi:hypothetical protein
MVRTSTKTAALLAPLVAGILFAQADRGTITGTVTDANGAHIPDVLVTATHLSTNIHYNAATSAGGEFTIADVPVGEYHVTMAIAGFKTAVFDRATIDAGGTIRLDAKLEVGNLHQAIEVNADNFLLQTDDAKMQNEISDKMIEGLPTVVSGSLRSPFDLAAITATVSPGDQTFKIGGGQASGWGVQLDGTSAGTNRANSTVWAAVNAPSLEAISQFRVETNGFKAEYGRAGGGVVSFVSKSGTNQYHGTAFDFVRNDAFDARGFFAISVPVYRQNDFGASMGGPVRIPKLYNGKDKTFFFFSYEGFRNRVGVNPTPVAVPPPEFLQGDFRNAISSTKILQVVYDPATTTYDATRNQYVRTAFPNNIVPQSRFDPIAAKIVALAAPAMTAHLRKDVVPGTYQYWQQDYYQEGSSINPNDKYSIKIDHSLNEKNRFSFYYGYSKQTSVPGPDGPPGIPGIMNPFLYGSNTSPVYRGSWDYTINAQVHNRFYFGINNFVNGNYPLSPNGDGICIPNVSNCNLTLPVITTSEFGTWGGVGYNGSNNPTYSYNDDISWVKGRHTFKAGYLYEYAPYTGIGEQNVAGAAGFGVANTDQPGAANTGFSFASFLLGQANSATINTPRFVGMKWAYNAMYFQDDWRVAPNLTLNLGVRYEFNLSASNDNGQCADFSPTTPNPGAGGRPGALVFCGDGPGRGGSSVIPPGWYGGVGPRLGLAWNPLKDWVIRGGAGASYAPVKSVSGSAHFQGFAQILTFSDQTGGITPVMQLSQGMPPWNVPPFIDPTFGNNGSVDWWQGQEANRLPEMWNWNLSIQHQLKGKWLVDASYAAMVGTHLQSNLLNYDQININTLPASLNIFTNAGRNLLNTAFNNSNHLVQNAGFSLPYAQFPVTSSLAQALRPYPQYTAVSTANGGDHSGHSNYQSMLIKVTRRYGSGLLVDASYVLSKSLTDSDSAWGSGVALDQYNRRLDKALSFYDRTHELKVNWVYDLPAGKGQRYLNRGILARVVGGWRAGAVQHYASGVPIALTGAFGFPSGTIGNRPYVTTYSGWRAPTKGSSFDPNVDRYFNSPTFANWNGDVPTITSQGWFPLQPRNQIGNMTRTNPKMRDFPQLNENVTLSKTMLFGADNRREVDLRFEGYNVLNRVVFGTPNTSISSTNFGLVTTQANTPRALQMALKLIW